MTDDAGTRGKWPRLSVMLVAALLVTALLLVALGLAFPFGSARPWTALFAAKEDGSWHAVRIDGRAVPAASFRLSVTDGRVGGGRDGCNDWSYDAPQPDGERTIVTTLQGCPDDPLRRAYWTLIRDGRITLLADGVLRVSAGAHEALFRRCTWRTQRTVTETTFSEERVCSPV